MNGAAYERIFVLHAVIAILWLVQLPFIEPYWVVAQVGAHAILPVWTYAISRRGSRWLGLLLGHGGLIVVYAGVIIHFVIEQWPHPWALWIGLYAAAALALYALYCAVVVAILRHMWPPRWPG